MLGAPPGTVNGHLRVTEQGEIINEKYGLRGIALRTLEQVTGSLALATAMPRHRGNDEPEWHEIMDVIAAESRSKYRKLVYETPDFYEYFRAATPIDLIERMRIGSRPASRRSGKGIDTCALFPGSFRGRRLGSSCQGGTASARGSRKRRRCSTKAGSAR